MIETVREPLRRRVLNAPCVVEVFPHGQREASVLFDVLVLCFVGSQLPEPGENLFGGRVNYCFANPPSQFFALLPEREFLNLITVSGILSSFLAIASVFSSLSFARLCS